MPKRLKVALIVTIVALAVGECGLTGEASATWPAGGVRAVSGRACQVTWATPDQTYFYCPFISDSVFAATDDPWMYVDYHVGATKGSYHSTQVNACVESWTGSTFTCGDSSRTSGVGSFDIGLQGFGQFSSTNSIWDYYMVRIVETGETVDNIYGVSYGS
jgi:hypothetical protein